MQDEALEEIGQRMAAEERPVVPSPLLPAGTIFSCPQCEEGLYKLTVRATVNGIVLDDGKILQPLNTTIPQLLVNPNKTLQGIYAAQVWPEKKPSRRAMHEAAFEADWDAEELLPRHRRLVAPEHRNRGREVISLDWTLVHHERGPHIYGTTKSYDYADRRMARFQTTVTEEAVNRHLRLRGLARSLLQRTPTLASTSEQFAFAKGEQTFGQRCRAITREGFHSLLTFAQRLFAGGYSCDQVTEALMPA